jgi:hypothetical protein
LSSGTSELEEHNANDWGSMSLLFAVSISLLDCNGLSKGILNGTKLVSKAIPADLSANGMKGTITSVPYDATEGFCGSATYALDGFSGTAALEEGLSAVDASIDVCVTGSPSSVAAQSAARLSDFASASAAVTFGPKLCLTGWLACFAIRSTCVRSGMGKRGAVSGDGLRGRLSL